MRLAAAPISWGVSEVSGWGFQLDRDRVLADAARLGLRDIEAGPPGFLPVDAGKARELLRRRGVNVVGGFVTAVLHRPERLTAELAAVDAQAAWLTALGAKVLVLAAASGRDGYDAPIVLNAAEWHSLFEAVKRAVELADARGLTVALHPHMGTAIEDAASIDLMLSETDVPLCLDTGHVFLGGGDSVWLARRWAARVAHVHLKDVDAELGSAVRERRAAFADAVRHGLFRPLGVGAAKIAEVLAVLKASSYKGWAVLEQDIALAAPPSEANDPARDIARSRDFARAHG